MSLILLGASLGFAQKFTSVELYISPRNVSYGWYDNGIFQFKFNKKSIKVIYADRTYNTLTVKDSLFEMFYVKAKMHDSLYNNLVLNDSVEAHKKRIMILIPKHDTLFIDVNYNLIRKERCYKLTDGLREFIEGFMPVEIKENWKYNLWRR